MRISYRHQNNYDYWEERWSNVSIDAPMHNVQSYPLKYAEMAVADKTGAVLEAGCGPGRIVKFYHDAGYKITGIDFIGSVIDKLKQESPDLDVAQGDIRNLQFPAESFRYVLAFGLYHNLEKGLDEALAETARVLEPGGKLCASFRADNIQNRIVDKLADRKKDKAAENKERKFHKINFTEKEIIRYVEDADFIIERIYPVENMPLLYKFKFFRHQDHKIFNESLGRKQGYQLNLLGSTIQKILLSIFPKQFCNLFVLIARKAY